MFSPLRHPGYRHLFIAQVAALLGTGMATVALGLLAHRLAGANAGEVLGMALAIKMVAYIGVAPFASALAAKLPRKTLLVSLDIVRAGVARARWGCVSSGRGPGGRATAFRCIRCGRRRGAGVRGRPAG